MGAEENATMRSALLKEIYKKAGLDAEAYRRALTKEENEQFLDWAAQAKPEETLAAVHALSLNRSKMYEMLEQAEIDSLTGLHKREVFNRAMIRELQKLKDMPEGHIALGIVDIDNFKSFNTKYKYEGGDLAIRETAQRLRHHLRANDHTARWGGDEFVFAMNEKEGWTEGRLYSPLRRFSDHMAEFKVHEGSKRFSVSTSTGIVLIDAANANRPLRELFKIANIAVDNVKARGKGHTHILEARYFPSEYLNEIDREPA